MTRVDMRCDTGGHAMRHGWTCDLCRKAVMRHLCLKGSLCDMLCDMCPASSAPFERDGLLPIGLVAGLDLAVICPCVLGHAEPVPPPRPRSPLEEFLINSLSLSLSLSLVFSGWRWRRVMNE